MSPEDHTAAIRSLQSDVADFKSILNNGLRAMVQNQRTELAAVKEDIQLIRDALTGHVAKEDVIYEIFKRVMNTGVTITGALIALLLSIIGYLLVKPVGLQRADRGGVLFGAHGHEVVPLYYRWWQKQSWRPVAL